MPQHSAYTGVAQTPPSAYATCKALHATVNGCSLWYEGWGRETAQSCPGMAWPAQRLYRRCTTVLLGCVAMQDVPEHSWLGLQQMVCIGPEDSSPAAASAGGALRLRRATW